MQAPKKIANAGKEAGKKVLATDTAQGVVEAVVDKLEEITVDKADDVAATVKERAAKAGGRSPKRATAKKSGAKKSTAKKSTAKKSSAKKSSAKKSSAKKATAKKSAAKKPASKKKPASRKSAGRKKSTAKKR
jgi:hypothetical protein